MTDLSRPLGIHWAKLDRLFVIPGLTVAYFINVHNFFFFFLAIFASEILDQVTQCWFLQCFVV